MKKLLFSILLSSSAFVFFTGNVSGLERKDFQQKFRAVQSAGDLLKQKEACFVLLKTETLTPEQKFILREYSLRLAENRNMKAETRKEIIDTLTAYLKSPDSQIFSPLQRAKLLQRLVLFELTVLQDRAAAEVYFKELTELAKLPESGDIRALIGNLINSRINDIEFCHKAFFQAKNVLPPDRLTVFEIAIPGSYALSRGDWKTFSEFKKKAISMPFGPGRRECLRFLKRGTGKNIQMELLDAMLKDPELKPADRIRILSEKRNIIGDVSWFQRDFSEPDRYKRWRKLTDEMLQCGELDANMLFRNAETAFGYGDFAFSEDQVGRALLKNKGNLPDIPLIVYLWKKDHKKISELVSQETMKPKLSSDRVLFLKGVEFFDTHSFSEFISSFSTDTLGLKTDREKLLLMRKISDLFFRARRYEVCRDIYNGTFRNLYVKLEPKVYIVRFAENLPRTADGFVRTEYFDDWSGMETRFWVYGDEPNISNDIDVKRFLKESVQPQIDPAWRTGICGLCDAEGLHLYIRCEDPGVQEIITHKRDGGGLECYFRPDPDAVYQMWFLQNLPSAVDDVNVDWALPGPRYQLTDDVIFRDACMTKSGVAAHFFIPWYAFSRYLPFDGKMWYFGMQRWCKGGNQTISGQGHELTRMLQLQFKFTPDQLKAIKRTVCKTAYNMFKASKTLPVWRDDTALGDPEFYKSELESLVKELDEAGKLLEKSDTDIDMVYEKYLPLWSHFEHIVSEKRRNYLRRSFFQ